MKKVCISKSERRSVSNEIITTIYSTETKYEQQGISSLSWKIMLEELTKSNRVQTIAAHSQLSLIHNTISQHSTEQHSQIRVTRVDSGIETSEAEPM